MEYQLAILKENLIIDDIEFEKFSSYLALIGYEIDSSSIYPFSNSENRKRNLQNIIIQLKIPANRSELENETMLTKEFANIFSFKKNDKLRVLKKDYNQIFYKKYKNSQFFEYVDELSNSCSFSLYFYNDLSCQKRNTPSWITKKLIFYGMKPTNFFEDIFTLINLEYGNLFYLKKIEENKNHLKFSINILLTEKITVDQLRFAFLRFFTLIEICSSEEIKNFKIEVLSKNSQDISNFKKNKIIYLDKENFRNILGPIDWDLTIFKKMGIPIISKTEKKIFFSVPTFRKDLNRPIDVIEEYCRFLGYDFFKKDFSFLSKNPEKKFFFDKEIIKITKNYFLCNNFQEILTSPLLKDNSHFSLIPLTNPLNKDFSHLRSSILDSLLQLYLKGKVKSSLTGENRFFEIGRVFKYTTNENKQIFEENHLGGIIEIPMKKKSENIETELFQKNWLFFKGIIENYFRNFENNLITCKKSNSLESCYHPQNTVIFYFQEQLLGSFGQIHPRLKKDFNNSKNLLFLFEINLSILKASFNFSKVPNFIEFSKYPGVIRDISFSLSKDIDCNIIPNKLKEEIPFLQSCFYIDIFPNKEITKNINLSLKCQLQKKTDTLTTEEIELSTQKIFIILEKQFGAKIN